MRTLPSALVVAALTVVATLTGCTESDADLVIYSGRSEELVAPLIEDMEEELDVTIDVRYGDSAELAAQLLEEGDATEADLFFSQDAGALSALAQEGRLTTLDDELVGVVDERYHDPEGRWVATSARARVVTYDPTQAPEVTDFDSVDDLLDDSYRGEIGFAPTNASFQSFVTALRITRGEDGARQWLEDFSSLEPAAYDNNIAVLEAVDEGEVSLGLINHYYWYQLQQEVGAEAVNAKIHYLDSDDAGALVNVAGVGVLASSDATELASDAVEFLLSEEGQQYFADETAEYPVREGVESTTYDLVPLEQVAGAQIDLNDLASLDETLELLDEVGLT
ncbi:MAG: extracellular solute-binding protein [Actinomycetota bacterium]|nr:extracellular solute-binding protein [Actinomycetota bacterium]